MGNTDVLLYSGALIMAAVGITYASVPLYKLFCSSSGFGGTAKISDHLRKTEDACDAPRSVKMVFRTDTSMKLPWNFKAQQKYVFVKPGQSALAFFHAHNFSSAEVIGTSTYSVIPTKAAAYLNKIQCFCFEEQILGPSESVDMPVLFYLDPEFARDANMDDVHEMTLAYTFFGAKQQRNT